MKPPRTLPIDKDKPLSHETLKNHLDQISKALTNISVGTTAPGTAGAPAAPAAGTAVAVIDPDNNFAGHKVFATSPAAPNTEFAVAHPLKRIPVGFIYLGGSNAGIVYRGTSAWTNTQIFLKETQGTNVFTLLIL